MNICLAQIQSKKGDLPGNIDHHMGVLEQLKDGAVDLVMFPELSLSGYFPDIAASAALDPKDGRLDAFQRFADSSGISIGVGAPTYGGEKPLISVILFSPQECRKVVSKRYLHPDELAFFAAAVESQGILDFGVTLALAICYEISIAAHIEEAVRCGSDLYLASVAKTPSSMTSAKACLAEKARIYGIPILAVNCTGLCEGKDAGGGSAAIDSTGNVIAELSGTEEGLLIYDSAKGTTMTMTIDDSGALARTDDS